MTPCVGDDRFTSNDPMERTDAAELCRSCPIKADCLAGALERREAWGVWGGVDMQPGKGTYAASQPHSPCAQCGKALSKRYGEGARRFAKRRFCDRECGKAYTEARSHLRPINHGTDGGYRAHRRRDEEACAACRSAANLAKLLRDERRSA